MAANRVGQADTRLYWTATILFWITLIFSVLPDGLDWYAQGADVHAQSGTIARKLQWLPLFAVAAYILWVRRDVALGMLRYFNPFLIGFLIWVTVSVLWSAYPSASLRKVVLLGGIFAISLALQIVAWDPQRSLRHTRTWVSVLLFLSTPVTLLFYPTIVQPTLGEGWAGVTRSKNHLGLLAGFGLLLWLHAWAVRDASLRRALAWSAYFVVVLYLSRSASSILCTVMMVPVIWLWARPPLSIRAAWTVGALAVVAVIGTLLFAHLMAFGIPSWTELARPVAGSVGRDTTLTGRLEIWVLVIQEIGEHPWIGTGYGAFWLGDGGPAPWVTQDLYGILWQAHNGYLDVLNETGIVGFALTIGFLLFHAWQIARLLPHDRAMGILHAAFLPFFLISNMTESSIFRPMDLLFFLSIFYSLSLSRSIADIELRRSFHHASSNPEYRLGAQRYAE